MIVTVTLNPAVDKYIFLDELYLNKTNKIVSKKNIYGGKGINVSYFLSLLKQENTATGFIYSDDEKIFKERITPYILDDFVHIDGKTRENIKINYQGHLLEINDTNHIEKREWYLFLEHYEKYCQKGNIIVLSGSLPKGIDDNSYLELIKMAKKNDCFVILDSSKEALKSAYSYADMIKPNKEEYCYLKDIAVDDFSIDKITYDSANLLTLISLGAQGSILLYNGCIYKMAPLNVEVYSTVGAGDSMVAAFAYGMHNKLSIEKTIKLASALSSLVITENYTVDFENKLNRLIEQVSAVKL